MSATKEHDVLDRFTRLRYRGDISSLNAEGKSLLWRSGDLAARLILNDMALPLFDRKNFDGCTVLVHAERYLADRLAYELAPWPKGMIKDESRSPLLPLCPHCNRLVIKPDKCSACGKQFCSLDCTLDHVHPESETA